MAALDVLAGALRKHAVDREVAAVEEFPFGTRCVVEGTMEAPDGREPAVRSVWFIDAGEEVPRLVTAYPLERSKPRFGCTTAWRWRPICPNTAWSGATSARWC